MLNDHRVETDSARTVESGIEQDISAVTEEPKPWGFWATTGFSAIITLAYLAVCIVVAIVFVIAAMVSDPQSDLDQIAESLSESGLLMAVAGIMTTPVVMGLCVLFTYLRKGIRLKDYLAIKSVSWRQLLIWLTVLVGYAVISDTLTLIIGRPLLHESIIQAYTTSVFPPLLLFAVIICAPLAEECFVRGFMFKGFMHSWLGPVGAVVLTSLLWSMFHVQYDLYGVASIFVGGLLMGAARIRTKSVMTPLVMHIAMNLIATVELLIVQHF